MAPSSTNTLGLPKGVLYKIASVLDDASLFAFASTCKTLKGIQEEVKPNWRETIRLKSLLSLPIDQAQDHDVSGSWIMWVYRVMVQNNQSLYERSKLVSLACLHGCLSELKWLKSGGCEVVEENTWRYAGYGGHLSVLEWLRDEMTCWDSEACIGAALGGHLEVLKYLHSEGCPWDECACRYAARGGHLEVLKYLHSEGCPWDEGICITAAAAGQLEVLKWLRTMKCQWDGNTTFQAANLGHLEVLQWAVSQGCPIDEETCVGAARGGQMKTLKFLVSTGCPVDEGTAEAAEDGKDTQMLQWLRQNGCPMLD